MESSESPGKLEQARVFRKEQDITLRNLRTHRLKPEARKYLDILRQDPRYQESKQAVMQDRWEILAAKVPEFSPQAWETAGRVFSGVNNGVKAALLVEIAQATEPKTATGQGTYIAVDDLVNRFEDLFAGTKLLQALSKHHRSNLKKIVTKYCQLSLCGDLGLAEEYNVGQELVGFGITENGKNFGVPAALLTLAFENNTDQSAYPIFGLTGSSGDTRAPFNRTRVLDYIMRRPVGLREIDLLTALNLVEPSTAKTLELFDSLGLAKYKAVAPQTGETKIEYKLASNKNLDQALNLTRDSGLQNAIVEAIRQQAQDQRNSFSTRDIINKLSLEIKSRRSDKNLRKYTSRILSRLARKGVLLRVDDLQGGKKMSDITVTPKGRSLTINLIWPVLSTVSGLPMTEDHQKVMDEVQKNLPTFAKKSADLYYPYSKSSKITSKTGKEQEILQKAAETLRTSHKALTAKELAQVVRATPRTIRRLLSPTVIGIGDGKPNRVTRKTIRGVYYYEIAA